jgi:hypothetical protein
MGIKEDMLKQVNARVDKKKLLARQAAKPKTLNRWAVKFFKEVDNLPPEGFDGIITLALSEINSNIQTVDRRAYVIYKYDSPSNAVLEVHWSNAYVAANNCEPVLVIDPATAYLDVALDDF